MKLNKILSQINFFWRMYGVASIIIMTFLFSESVYVRVFGFIMGYVIVTFVTLHFWSRSDYNTEKDGMG